MRRIVDRCGRWMWALLLATAGCGADQPGGAAASASTKPSGPPATPVSLKEAIAVIDCNTLPVMDGAVYVTKSLVGSHFSVPKGDPAKAVEFYRTTLVPLGWKPAEGDAQLWGIYPQGAQLIFFKNGHAAYVSLGITPADGNLNCGLFHVGNVDARTLPQVAPPTKVVEATPARATYETAAKPDEVRDFARKEMTKLGWKTWDRPVPSGVPPEVRAAMQSQSELKFIQGPATVQYYVTPQDGKTLVMASVALLSVQVPLLSDAIGIEFSEDPLNLAYATNTPFDKVVEFHRKELSALGWKEREKPVKEEPKNVVLVFDAPNEEPIRFEVLHNKLTVVSLSRWKDEK